MKYVGIDYSMNSPAACCVDATNGWDVSTARFFYLTTKKTKAHTYNDGMIVGEAIRDYQTDTERFLSNAAAFKRWIQPDENVTITMEGYAFAAKGSRVFQIGEAGGILKTLLIHDMDGNLINDGHSLSVAPPTAVKKFATDKGNADKDMMYEAFRSDTNIDILSIMAMSKLANPVHDMSDAYWICKYGFNLQEQTTNDQEKD